MLRRYLFDWFFLLILFAIVLLAFNAKNSYLLIILGASLLVLPKNIADALLQWHNGSPHQIVHFVYLATTLKTLLFVGVLSILFFMFTQYQLEILCVFICYQIKLLLLAYYSCGNGKMYRTYDKLKNGEKI